MGILARVPLASGMLTGKLRGDSQFAADDHRNFNRHGEKFDVGETFSGVDYEAGLRAAEEVRTLLPQGMSMAQFAARWILMFDAVTCTFPAEAAGTRCMRTAAHSTCRRSAPKPWPRSSEILQREDSHACASSLVGFSIAHTAGR